MRVLTVVLALVAMPFVASLSQEPAEHESGDKPGVRHAYAYGHQNTRKCDNDQRSDAEHADRKDDDHDRVCGDPPPPPPPPPPPTSNPCTPPTQPAGGATISGIVYNGWGGPGLACSTITATDGATTWTTITDATGNFSLTIAGSPTALYNVCQVAATGYHQTFPAAGFFQVCGLGGWGYQFNVGVGSSATVFFVDAVGP